MTIVQVQRSNTVVKTTRVGGFPYQGGVPIASRQQTFGEASPNWLSNGTDLGQTSVIRHHATQNGGGLRLLYTNQYGGYQAGPNQITVRAGLTTVAAPADSDIVAVTFNGASSVVLDPGESVLSDPVNLTLTAFQAFWSRTFVSVSQTGFKWPTDLRTRTVGSQGEGVLKGAGTASDYDASHTALAVAGAVPSVIAYSYGPTAICATTGITGKTNVVAVIGTSITHGVNASPTDDGYAVAALGIRSDGTHALAQPFGLVRMTFRGLLLSLLMTAPQYVKSLLAGVTHAHVEWGVNDIYNGQTLAQLQANYQTFIRALLNRGIKVVGSTIPPRTTSTDSWNTAANQTPANTGTAGHGTEADRTAFNDWLRANWASLGLAALSELADTVECNSAGTPTRNGGLWLPNYTDDGVHPLDVGHNAMAAAINTTQFA